MKTLLVQFLLIAIIITSCGKKETLKSPDNSTTVTIQKQGYSLLYSVNYNNKQITNSSPLKLELKDNSFFSGDFKILEVTNKSVDTTWIPPFGKVSSVKNNYNEYTVKLQEKSNSKRKMDIIFRLYNDGVAYKYLIPVQANIDTFTIVNDNSLFAFTKDMQWWSGNDEHPNLHAMSVDSLPKTVKPPFVAEFDSTTWVSICEAAIYNYSDFVIAKGKEHYSVGTKMYPSKGKTGVPTSWRVLRLGKSAGDFLESNILENLNPESKIKDVSWIKPGKSMWDWRVWNYTAPDGFVYGLNTVSHKRFVDFASENNIDYLLIDADWYGPEFDEDSDPTKARSGVNIHEIIDYATKKGVKVILYINDVGAKKYGLDNILSTFHEWGAAGIKYGFMEGHGIEKVSHTRLVVETCAKYHLTVNFHDLPIPPSGDSRTWPNLIAREYCHAQADAYRTYYPETAISAAFVNLTLGPVDMGNGWYDLNKTYKRERVFQPLFGTIAGETAKLVVFYTPLAILPDAPEEYSKKADIFDFIKNLPNTFDEIKVLGGTPDSYISVARRAGNNWYVGTLTNRTGRTLDIKLDFLEEGVKYKAELFEDTKDNSYFANKEDYKIRTIDVTKDSVVNITLAPGGGNSMRIIPIK